MNARTHGAQAFFGQDDSISKPPVPQTHNATFYLSEQEVERIQAKVKAREERCSQLQGQQRERRGFKEAKSQAIGASLLADMGGAEADKVPVIAVGQPYPASVVSKKDLKPMKMADLRIGTHHRGFFLTFKRVCPVVILKARSWTMVQDESGKETERLEICVHKLQYGEDALESANIFLVKEPYFTLTEEGEPTIRIDHPSDLVIYPGKQEIEDPDPMDDLTSKGKDSAAVEKLAKTYKDSGNAALKTNNLPLAQFQYTKGVDVAQGDVLLKKNRGLARDLHRNRAHANLLLGRFNEALSDAKASLLGAKDQRSKELDSKALFRATRAAYGLQEFEEALAVVKDLLKLTPGDKEASIMLRLIDIRLREQDTGSHNLEKLKRNLSKARPRIDAANFIRNTIIKPSPGRGRGLFATRDLAAGEIIIIEKAFCVLWAHEKEVLTTFTHDFRDNRIRIAPAGLTRSVVEKLLNNPSQIERVLSMYGDWQGDSDSHSITATEDGPVVDVFRVYDIVCRNAFSPGDQFGGDAQSSAGLWIYAAAINHSCVPNSTKECMGDLMIFRATKAIKAGEEIFHAYNESRDFAERRKALLKTWGFECSCRVCEKERKRLR